MPGGWIDSCELSVSKSVRPFESRFYRLNSRNRGVLESIQGGRVGFSKTLQERGVEALPQRCYSAT